MTTHLTRPARATPSTPRSGSALFLREFVRSPLATASIIASSAALARQMADPLNRLNTPNPVVLELGPGTGAFTGAIAAAAPAADAIADRLGDRVFRHPILAAASGQQRKNAVLTRRASYAV